MSQVGSLRGLRSSSSNSDILSLSAVSTSRASLPAANPAPAYVSASEAENLLYGEIERTVRISDSVVHTINSFLDQVLYDILAKAHSTALGPLRAAVPIVLKQRLGKAAVKAADEELQDYLEPGEWEQLQAAGSSIDRKSDFDPELAWKLTRLRCMVYAKLGDMEEEDEEEYLEDEDLRQDLMRAKDSTRMNAQIAPAAAIFATTVIEFLGEQAFCIAAQHARKRYTSSRTPSMTESLDSSSSSVLDDILLEDIDLSGLGKEGPLIRLWRSWKGSHRSTGSFSRPTTPNVLSPVTPDSPTNEWKAPPAPYISTIHEEHSPSDPDSPANIPLPISDRDVEEIEVPGVAPTLEDEEEGHLSAWRPKMDKRRPTSMLVIPGAFPPSLSTEELEKISDRPTYGRTRSYSLPAPAQSPFATEGAPAPKEDDLPQEDVEAEAQPQEPAAQDDPEPVVEEQLMRSGTRHGSRSNGISDSAIAAVAGALSVEASRASRRNGTIYQSPPPQASAHARNASASTHPGDDSEQPQAPMQTQTGTGEPNEHHDDSDPEDLALSSADEAAAEEDHHHNLRDSGVGVASEDGLPIQGHDDADYEDDHNVIHQAQIATAHRATPPIDSDHRSSNSINRTSNPISETGRSALPLAIATTAAAAAAAAQRTSGGSPLTPSAPANVPARGSSLERPVTRESPADRRFPQHVPTSQRAVEPEPTLEQQVRPTPREVSHAPSSSAGSQYVYTIRSGGANGVNGRPGTAGSATNRRQHLRLRSESEDGHRRGPSADDLDAAKKSLDVLINSDETLHYTLTPEQARAGRQQKPKIKTQTQELADFFRTTAPPGNNVTRPKSSRSVKDTINGLRSNPPKSPKSTTVPLPSNGKPLASQSNAQPATSSPVKHRNPLGEPREARATAGNMRDLADYARSTGPENEMQLPKALAGRPDTASSASVGHVRNGISAAAAAGANSRPTTTSSSKSANRLKHQARDARAPRSAENSDLIDFIREGPPRAAGEHRIDRHVAPFRTTMDSDDLQALAPPRDLDPHSRNSDGSAQESSVTVKSVQSTINSRTGLLDSTNRAGSKFTNGLGSSAAAVGRQPSIPEADGLPPRTRRKPRDPYAIDFSDDEMEEEQFIAPPRRGEEESLVDFLRNTAPPPGMTTKPILAAAPEPTPTTSASGGLKRTASTSKLKEYLQGTVKSNGARAESPHLTKVGSKMDQYRPTQPTHASHVDRNRQRMRAEARDATTPTTGTADLAAFLRDSGPPPSTTETNVQRFVTSSPNKDQASFMKFFSRQGSVRK